MDIAEHIDLAVEPEFRLGALAVEPGSRRVRSSVGEAQLEPRVMEVLIVLARAQGRILGREELRQRCWGGRIVSDDAIERVMARIRRICRELAQDSCTLETIAKVGYRLEVVPEAPPQAPSTKRRWAIAALAAAAIVLVAFFLLREHLFRGHNT